MMDSSSRVRQEDGSESVLLCTKRVPMSRKQKPRSPRRWYKSERGQGLIELAIALPALLLLLMGMLDVGRVYWTLVSLKDAVAEGALYAASYPTQTTQIKERAAESSNMLVALSPDLFSVEYVAPPTAGQTVTVTVAYTLELLNPVITAIVPGATLTIRAADRHVIY